MTKQRDIIPYRPELKERARELRRNMTLAEVLLWKRLKNKQMMGYDFDRQRPIDKYIVDFYSKDLRLAIEVDGRSHDHKKEADQRRQAELEKLDVHFLRFWDAEVKQHMQLVLGRIEAWIREHEPTPVSPPRRGTD